MKESRNLGPIELDGGSGGGAMEGMASFQGRALPVRVEIDFPERLSDAIVDDVDMVLDNLAFVDGLARNTIETGMRWDASAPAKLFEAWEQKRSGREGAHADFLDQLRPTRILILPDGGLASRERVAMTYGVADGTVSGTVTVRFMEPTGPELAPAPRAGFA
jgi:hypothetical protein